MASTFHITSIFTGLRVIIKLYIDNNEVNGFKIGTILYRAPCGLYKFSYVLAEG